MVVMKKQNIVITDQTGCKSSLISVYTICQFKTTIYTPYIDRVNRVKKRSDCSFRKGQIWLYSICSGMIRCLKDSLEIANSVNTDQTYPKSSLTSVYPFLSF